MLLRWELCICTESLTLRARNISATTLEPSTRILSEANTCISPRRKVSNKLERYRGRVRIEPPKVCAGPQAGL